MAFLTHSVQQILSYYESDVPGVKANLASLLMHGQLKGTGSVLMLAVDQGFEHGPDRSYGMNEDAYDPLYHFRLAIEGGASAYAAPLGWLEAGASSFAGEIPLILKVNSRYDLLSSALPPDQAVTASVEDALRLGCRGIGFTIYPGSAASLGQIEELRDMAREARQKGLVVVVWSYPRGDLTAEAEQSLDTISYGAHVACLLGAHIVKVKVPVVWAPQNAKVSAVYQKHGLPVPQNLSQAIEHVTRACFRGRRLVIFSGGETQSEEGLLSQARAISQAGGRGMIIGRNAFQRPYKEGVELFRKIAQSFKK
jgi:class I fructose-bisphosphate aldolase